MKQTVTLDMFREAFKRAGRDTQFSHEGLEVLFDYLEEWESAGTMEEELDVIALCCGFAEQTPQEIACDYGLDITGCDGGEYESMREIAIEHLDRHSVVAGETDTTIIYQKF